MTNSKIKSIEINGTAYIEINGTTYTYRPVLNARFAFVETTRRGNETISRVFPAVEGWSVFKKYVNAAALKLARRLRRERLNGKK